MLADHLYQQIQSRYTTKQLSIALSAEALTMTVVVDPDALLEDLSREDSAGRLYLPYWLYIWESAIGLTKYLDGVEVSEAEQILEVGCGVGLAGIAACKRGAHVLFTDNEKDALLFAQYNALQNRCLDHASFVQMDWKTPCLNGQFSRILAADVIYQKNNWQHLLEILQKYLAVDGQALFAEPSRKNAAGFLNLIHSHQFTYQKHTHNVSIGERTTRIAIYNIKKASET